ncbi:MAG TPA: ABC transporter ATP-binding protein [Symbiobacteriaceae bacterium]|nr:ABC transporter ATP-binding protein [Symbiobacteriaceae bacterium]
MHALKTVGLTRLYRNGRGIRNVNLEVQPGEIFGFLGPNGAGKTTLIRNIMGLLRPQQGSITVLGLDAVSQSRAARHKIGYLPSDPALYDFLTGEQNLAFAMAVRGVKDRGRLKTLVDRLDMDLKRRLKTLSRGNKQKVALAAALVHDPEVLILDEPTTGLDPLVQETFCAIIREEQRRGKTVFMSSHVLSEVETLCDRVGVIRDGEIVAVDNVENLRKRRVKYVTCQFAETVPDLSAMAGITEWAVDGAKARFTLSGDLNTLIGELSKVSLTDLTVTDPPLEEVFRAFYEGSAGR